jgi:hypothetical protein
VSSVSTATNCIFWGSEVFHVYLDESSNATINYSIVRYFDNTFPGAGNMNTDPLFEDATNGNLHLSASSPAIDRGNNAANNEVPILKETPV